MHFVNLKIIYGSIYKEIIVLYVNVFFSQILNAYVYMYMYNSFKIRVVAECVALFAQRLPNMQETPGLMSSIA